MTDVTFPWTEEPPEMTVVGDAVSKQGRNLMTSVIERATLDMMTIARSYDWIHKSWKPEIKILWEWDFGRSRGGVRNNRPFLKLRPYSIAIGLQRAAVASARAPKDRSPGQSQHHRYRLEAAQQGKWLSPQYNHVVHDVEIGAFVSGDWRDHLIDLVAHELAHAIQYTALRARPEMRRAHGEGWAMLYGTFRREYVNPRRWLQYRRTITREVSPLEIWSCVAVSSSDASGDADGTASAESSTDSAFSPRTPKTFNSPCDGARHADQDGCHREADDLSRPELGLPATPVSKTVSPTMNGADCGNAVGSEDDQQWAPDDPRLEDFTRRCARDLLELAQALEPPGDDVPFELKIDRNPERKTATKSIVHRHASHDATGRYVGEPGLRATLSFPLGTLKRRKDQQLEQAKERMRRANAFRPAGTRAASRVLSEGWLYEVPPDTAWHPHKGEFVSADARDHVAAWLSELIADLLCKWRNRGRRHHPRETSKVIKRRGAAKFVLHWQLREQYVNCRKWKQWDSGLKRNDQLTVGHDCGCPVTELELCASEAPPVSSLPALPETSQAAPTKKQRKWFSAAELLGVPGMPGSVSAIHRLARKEKWKRRRHGREWRYHVSHFPERARISLNSVSTRRGGGLDRGRP